MVRVGVGGEGGGKGWSRGVGPFDDNSLTIQDTQKHVLTRINDCPPKVEMVVLGRGGFNILLFFFARTEQIRAPSEIGDAEQVGPDAVLVSRPGSHHGHLETFTDRQREYPTWWLGGGA